MSADLYQELNDKMEQSYQVVADMKRHGRERAEAEAEYRTALALAEQSLRTQTSLPASLIPDVARGQKRVTEAKKTFDYADVEYTTDRELVMLLKRDVDTIREQIAREWSQAGARTI